MKAKVYTADWCPHCKRAKELLQKADIEFEEVDVETDEGMEEFRFIMRNLGVKSIPQVFVDEEFVGGYKDLKKFLKLL